MSEQLVPQDRRDDRVLPDQVTMGLLPYLTAHAVDEDYVEVASRRVDPPVARSRPRIGAAGAVVLAIFAALAVTAAVQTSQDSVSQERERRALVDQVKQRKATVDADRLTVAKLRTETKRLETELVRNSRDSTTILAELDLLRTRAGTAPVHGPGVEIDVDDAKGAESDRFRVLDTDLQKIVNGLWRAGAEAISINGQRLTALSPIRHGGQGITVNFRELTRPYRVLAIGDALRLPSRFIETTSGQAWLDAQREVGLRFSIRAKSSLRLPAAKLPSFRFVETSQTPQEKRSS
ncbi:uncharacterized protein YlxW (UPF0749 family) [Marmoricola sp. URHA0025 HA25]